MAHISRSSEFFQIFLFTPDAVIHEVAKLFKSSIQTKLKILQCIGETIRAITTDYNGGELKMPYDTFKYILNDSAHSSKLDKCDLNVIQMQLQTWLTLWSLDPDFDYERCGTLCLSIL